VAQALSKAPDLAQIRGEPKNSSPFGPEALGRLWPSEEWQSRASPCSFPAQHHSEVGRSRWTAGLKSSAGVSGSSYLLVLRAVGPKLVVGLAHPYGDDESVLIALKAGARSCR